MTGLSDLGTRQSAKQCHFAVRADHSETGAFVRVISSGLVPHTLPRQRTTQFRTLINYVPMFTLQARPHWFLGETLTCLKALEEAVLEVDI